MAENIMVTMVKALIKGKLGIGELTGKERFMLAQLGMPDRVPTMLAATNIEPADIDPDYDYVRLSKNLQDNLDLFEKVMNKIHADQIMAPGWFGVMGMGAAELGTRFKITKDRVPYSVEYPIKEYADLEKLSLPEEASGYFKMFVDMLRECQNRYPDMFTTLSLDGPWDLAMLLRGDQHLPIDMRIHKDYCESEDPERRKKIRQHGDPDFYPALMEFCAQLSIRLFELAEKNGVSMMGAAVVDQYATSPMMSRSDFVNYVLPYIEKVWTHFNKKLQIGYMCQSPKQIREILENEPPGINHEFVWSNYIFHTTPEGITLPEYDKPAFELAKEHNQLFSYMLHGKFLRDANREEIEQVVQRVLGLATDIGTKLILSIVSVPPGTDLDKVNYTFSLANKYGRY